MNNECEFKGNHPLPLLQKEGIFLPFSRGDARGVL
jgi:hypothetical protein